MISRIISEIGNLITKCYEYAFSLDRSRIWHQDGYTHRSDGPAITNGNGDKYWYYHGKKHRIDGPAIIYANGTRFWFINNQDITYDVEKWLRGNKNIPQDHNQWTDEHKMLFKLTFG